MFKDRTVSVQFEDGNISTYNISLLSFAKERSNGLEKGDGAVLTAGGDHYNVTIKEIFQDGKVSVKFDDGNISTYDISMLSHALNSLNGLEVGNKVVLTAGGDHYNVTILEIFQDSKVSVKFDDGNISTYDISLLSRAQIRMNNLEVGDNAVLTAGGDHYNVIIKEIFQDGKVSVAFSDGNISTYDISLLSKSIECTNSNECRHHHKEEGERRN